MRKALLKGRCHKGLYPLPVESLKLAFGAFKPFLARWHSRLRHPSIPIAERIVSKFNLPCSSESNKNLYVMHAKEPRVINFLIRSPILVRVIL
jgi:hypothetical protein